MSNLKIYVNMQIKRFKVVFFNRNEKWHHLWLMKNFVVVDENICVACNYVLMKHFSIASNYHQKLLDVHRVIVIFQDKWLDSLL